MTRSQAQPGMRSATTMAAARTPVAYALIEHGSPTRAGSATKKLALLRYATYRRSPFWQDAELPTTKPTGRRRRPAGADTQDPITGPELQHAKIDDTARRGGQHRMALAAGSTHLFSRFRTATRSAAATVRRARVDNRMRSDAVVAGNCREAIAGIRARDRPGRRLHDQERAPSITIEHPAKLLSRICTIGVVQYREHHSNHPSAPTSLARPQLQRNQRQRNRPCALNGHNERWTCPSRHQTIRWCIAAWLRAATVRRREPIHASAAIDQSRNRIINRSHAALVAMTGRWLFVLRLSRRGLDVWIGIEYEQDMKQRHG